MSGVDIGIHDRNHIEDQVLSSQERANTAVSVRGDIDTKGDFSEFEHSFIERVAVDVQPQGKPDARDTVDLQLQVCWST